MVTEMIEDNSVQAEYARLAPTYDRRWAFYIGATIQATLQRLDLSSNATVLDLGCGTGVLLQQLVNQYPTVTLIGLDTSAAMLEAARKKLPPSIELHLSSVEQLPFPASQFDCIISTSAFHYFRNPAQAIREMARVLKRNGRLLLTDWCRDYWTMAGLDLWLKLTDRAHFKTYSIRELKDLLDREGFQSLSIEQYRINWFWGLMTVQAVKVAENNRE